MLNKKNIAIAMAVATVAPVAAPLVAMADEVKKVEITAGETEKIEKVKAELEAVKKIKYTNNEWVQNSQGSYYKEYTKFEKNIYDGSDKDVSVYRVERSIQDGKEVIKVIDRGHSIGFEGNDKAIVDFDSKGNNIEEKLVAEVTIHIENSTPEYNVDAQLLYKSNGKYTEQGSKLFAAIKNNAIVKEETVAEGNKTGIKYTIASAVGSNANFVVTIWGQPKTNTEDSIIGSLAGLDRCETAAQVSQQGWKDGSADTIVLTGWNGTPDALSATPLASALNAPILLTETTKVNEHTKAEIDRLKARNVIIVGGEVHVDKKVEAELKAMGLNVKRIAGEDRTRTSFEIAKALETTLKMSGKSIDDVYIAGGYNGEADALSISSHAGNTEQPILLIEKNRVADDVKIWIQSQKDTKATIIGGTYAVDNNAQGEIAGSTQHVVKRIGGSNIQETNAAVINEFHKDSKSLLIAQDNILADALAAGPLAAKMDAPIVLGKTDPIINEKGITESQEAAIKANVKVENKVDYIKNNVFNVGHGVSRSVVRFIESILPRV